MDITKGQGFEVLCPFLGLPDPSVGFPRANKAGDVRSTQNAYPANKPEKVLSRNELASLFGQIPRG